MMIDKYGVEKIYEVKTSGNLFEEEEEVIVFTDITELKNKNNLLMNQSRQAAMGDIIAMIAHQWRQPLTTVAAILGKIKIKQDMQLLTPQELKDSIEKGKTVIQHLSKTIDQFQDYFKIKDGKQVATSELLQSVHAIINPIFEKFEIQNSIHFYHNDSFVDDRLDQVLLNIYQNASDALREKGQNNSSIVHTEVSHNENNQLVIQICDNGGGIPNDVINKIFIPYFSTKAKNGSGLGLYMSKDIVENKIGGTIEVSNKEDGACFKIILPNNKTGQTI
jgi:signal transduction histidine kinase